MTPLRVLLVSPQSAVPEYRKRLEVVGSQVELLALVPRDLKDAFAKGGVSRPEPPKSYTLLELGVPFHSRSGTRYLLKIPPTVWRRFRPDIVHVEQELWSLSVLQALLYREAFSPNARLVVSTWENLPRSGLKGRILSPLLQWVVPRTSLILSANQDGAALVVPYGARKTSVRPQIGVDPNQFHPLVDRERAAIRASLGLPEGAFVACFVGRLVPEKGLLNLLEAWKEFAEDRAYARLLFVGDGPMRGTLIEAGSQILVLPAVPRGETARFYQASDVSLLASRTTASWKEQFGLSLLESMACEVPPIGSTSGAIPEVIGEAGLLFPEGDAKALSSQLRKLHDNPSLRRALGASVRNRVLQRYTHEKVALGLVAEYRSLAETSRHVDG